MALLFLELPGLHCAEHTLMGVIRLIQWLHKPLKCTIHTLHRRSRNRQTAVETIKEASELRQGTLHGVR
jgi:hypothetical protein